jgi:DNA-binding NtrC family response regulator
LTSKRTLHADDFTDNAPAASSEQAIPFPATLVEINLAAARAMLDYCNGNKSETARRLGISRPRLQRLLDEVADPNLNDEAEVER